MGVIVTAGAAFTVLLTGKTWHLNWYRVTPTRVALIVVGLLMGAWAYKIVRALAVGSGSAAG